MTATHRRAAIVLGFVALVIVAGLIKMHTGSPLGFFLLGVYTLGVIAQAVKDWHERRQSAP